MTILKILQQDTANRFDEQWKKSNILHYSVDNDSIYGGTLFVASDETKDFVKSFIHAEQQRVWDKAIDMVRKMIDDAKTLYEPAYEDADKAIIEFAEKILDNLQEEITK